MSDTNAPEPTMEEILASIRRIISEDEAPAPAAAEAAATPADPPRPVEAAPAHEDVLELTDRVEAEPPAPPPVAAPVMAAPPAAAAAPAPRPAPKPVLGDLDFSDPPPAAARPAASPPPPAPAFAASHDEPLVGGPAEQRAASHFGALTSSLAMPGSGRTLEDVVRELLRPLLKDWLDQNLPQIVEARVQDEVERISRRRSY